MNVGLANAADFTQIGPQATPEQIISARNSTDEPVVRFVFSVSGGRSMTQATTTIDLAADYTFVRGDGPSKIIDYKLRRIYSLDDSTHSVGNLSLYAMVDFRVAETFNRRFLRKMLNSIMAPNSPESNNPFWVQSSLHVMDPADPTPQIDRHSGADGSAHYLYKGVEVASYALSDQVLSLAEESEFARFLREQTSLHPLIINALVADGRVPKQLSFTTPPEPKQSLESWTLQSVSRQAVPFPLPRDYGVALTTESKSNELSPALKSVLPLMLDAIAGRAANGPRTVSQYRTLIDDALRQKNGLQAVLWAFEGIEQYSQVALDCAPNAPPSCKSLREVFAEAQSDPRVGELGRSLQTEQTDPQAAVNLRRGLKRDDISNGYVIDGFIGNTLNGMGKRDEALPLLVSEVRGDPYVAGYYKDLGDLFRESFDPVSAWICYDLGRALPGGSSAPVVEKFGDYEAHLAAAYAQFF